MWRPLLLILSRRIHILSWRLPIPVFNSLNFNFINFRMLLRIVTRNFLSEWKLLGNLFSMMSNLVIITIIQVILVLIHSIVILTILLKVLIFVHFIQITNNFGAYKSRIRHNSPVSTLWFNSRLRNIWFIFILVTIWLMIALVNVSVRITIMHLLFLHIFLISIKLSIFQ